MEAINKFIKISNIAIIIVAIVLLSYATLVNADTSSTTLTVGNAAPTLSSLNWDNGNNVTLTENTLVYATATVTVTDTNGCNEITSTTATFYLSSSTTNGTTCTYDASTCYTSICIATTSGGNTCTGGADTSVEYDCGFRLWYPATATDGSAPIFSTDIWAISATSSDGTDQGTATNTTQTIEVATLTSLDITGTIAYGSVSAGSDTSATNQTVTHTNTGNIALDNQISGDLMCTDYNACAGNVMQPTQQKFGLSDVTYASLTNTLAATSSPATIQVILVKPTATTSAVTDLSYWGNAVPGGQASGSYTGQNTFTAVAD